MKLRRAFSLLTGVALLGAIGAYIETTRTTAQSPDRRPANPANSVVNSGPADAARTVTQTADAAVESPPSAGNPLWALPLKQLSTTRDRPIFSPSRRPPPSATPTYVAPVAVRQPQKAAEPEQPAVTLLGTVIGDGDRIGVFVEAATGTMVRMRVGEDHQGWVLRLIKSREVTLVKDRELVVVLELPAAGEQAALGYGAIPGAIPGGIPGGVAGGAPAGGTTPRGAGWMPPGGIVGLPGGVPGATLGVPPGRRQPGR